MTYLILYYKFEMSLDIDTLGKYGTLYLLYVYNPYPSFGLLFRLFNLMLN